MQVKRYEAANLQEATLRIKRELGSEAIILSTKKLSDSPPLFEVLAARDDKANGPAEPPPPAQQARQAEPESRETVASLMREIRGLRAGIEGLRQNAAPDHLEFREAVEALLDHASAGNPPTLRQLYLRLTANGLSRAKSFGFIEAIKKSHPPEAFDSLEKGLALAGQMISRSLGKNPGEGKRIKAFVGPTGVGKTTTLAKLAAHYLIDKKMTVGLITTDTYRIAAAEQLKVYGKIMGLPVHTAPGRTEFLRSLKDLAEKDVILVDTPGRSPLDEQGLGQTASLFNGTVDVHLLMSPAASPEYLAATANNLKVFNYDRLILTKIDECRRFGPLCEFLEEVGKPVSHLTTGQNVPRDIEPASPERLARLVLHNHLN
ncbi:MAG: flagellar biosynthesis protein FlhF [Syntrophaceae bacterium]|nr:flagellar biosynthesis protein FlhF [Syntrophaceae bacterium]